VDLKALHRANVDSVTLDAVPAGLTLTDGVLTGTSTATADATLTPTMTALTSDGESLATVLSIPITFVPAATYSAVISMSHGTNVDPDLTAVFGPIPADNWQVVDGFGTLTGTNLEDDDETVTTVDVSMTNTGGNGDTRATGSGAAWDMMRRGAGSPSGAQVMTISDIGFAKGDVAVLFDERTGSVSGVGATISDGTTTVTLTETTGGAKFTGTFVEDVGAGGNYVLFSDLTGGTYTISFDADAANAWVWAGTQIGVRSN